MQIKLTLFVSLLTFCTFAVRLSHMRRSLLWHIYIDKSK